MKNRSFKLPKGTMGTIGITLAVLFHFFIVCLILLMRVLMGISNALSSLEDTIYSFAPLPILYCTMMMVVEYTKKRRKDVLTLYIGIPVLIFFGTQALFVALGEH